MRDKPFAGVRRLRGWTAEIASSNLCSTARNWSLDMRPASRTVVNCLSALLLGFALATAGSAIAAKGGTKGGGGGGKGGGHGGNEPPPAPAAVHLEGAGDSIMRGYNASCTSNTKLFSFLCYGGGDQPQNSFFDGSSDQVTSLLDDYLTISEASASQAAAASGSEMTDPAHNNFAAQANAIIAAVSSPTRVVIELGGNDICNRGTVDELYDDATWTAAVDAGLELLVNGLPDGSTVLIAGVPRVQDLRAAGIALQQSASSVDCEAFWSSFDVCRIATASDAALAAIGDRQRRYNEILRDRAAAYNDLALQTGVEVVTDYIDEVSTSVGTYSFGAGDINGGDCFHPSIEGQNTLAEMLFNSSQ
jgi:lysophospholipase L1-like esterase